MLFSCALLAAGKLGRTTEHSFSFPPCCWPWREKTHIEVSTKYFYVLFIQFQLTMQSIFPGSFCQKFRQVQYYFCPVIKVTLVMIICGVRLHLYQFFLFFGGRKSHISRKLPQKTVDISMSFIWYVFLQQDHHNIFQLSRALRAQQLLNPTFFRE